MSKFYVATIKSFKGKHPQGLVTQQVVVKASLKKDGVELAKKELEFWDAENIGCYQAPKLVEGTAEDLANYLASKESAGQTDIEDAAAPTTSTTNLFDHESAQKAEFPIVEPWAVWVALAQRNEKYVVSFSIVNRSSNNAVALGFINSFFPQEFSTVENAVSFALGKAIDGITAHLPQTMGETAGRSVNILQGYAKDPETQFADRFVRNIDLSNAKFINVSVATSGKGTAPQQVKPVAQPPKAKAPSVNEIFNAVLLHPDYRNCASPYNTSEFINLVKANFMQLMGDYKLNVPAIVEHINGMSEIRDLAKLGACEEIIGLYAKKTPAVSAEEILDEKVYGEALLESADADVYQKCIAKSLATIENAHNELTAEQYEEAAEKLKAVLEEASDVYNNFDALETMNMIQDVDWDSANEAYKTFLNIRSLRILVRENAVYLEESEDSPATAVDAVKGTKSLPLNTESLPTTNYNKADHWQHLAFQLMESCNEHKYVSAELTAEYAANLREAFQDTHQSLFVVDSDDKYYSDAASRLMTHIKDSGKAVVLISSSPSIKQLINKLMVKKDAEEEKSNPTIESATETRPDDQYSLTAGAAIANSDACHSDKSGSVVSLEASHNEKSNVSIASGNRECTSGDVTNTDGSSTAEPVAVLNLNEQFDELEKQWSEDHQIKENMSIWSRVHRTDRRFTKKDHNERTSIKTQYRIMRATELFGPMGIGWGYRVVREWSTEGSPIVINDTVTQYREMIHHCEIAFWYTYQGKRSEDITNYGDTKQFYYSRGYQNKPGYFVNDDEVLKKSLSDALGKCLSMIGVCADVYLGEHDDAHLETLTRNEINSYEQKRHAEEETRIREKVISELAEINTSMEAATTKAKANELRGLALISIHALPDINEEQKRSKSNFIQKLELKYRDTIARIDAEASAKKATKESTQCNEHTAQEAAL
ncbi:MULTISPECIES: hypothetical protein [unclassified Vibrio]|uniref:hypothetical protein n=1 Tax=unclassified Vibrio TaxID=2614977 RepID=UPI0013612063|nr:MULTISPECIES: hypothetical protein [unclassified Vibrio]NAW56103.1 hypothetical protein [Vibrio sp. V36_P2S2PM302]NAX26552.1 hypothetical protein [Vibrio sp. V38_P2S17PM301]NAX30072.1 hypothetical protein [Vibrio sp. V37_P2S8PM304]